MTRVFTARPALPQEDLKNIGPRIKAGYRSSDEFHASRPKTATAKDILALLKQDQLRKRNAQQQLEQPETQELEISRCFAPPR